MICSPLVEVTPRWLFCNESLGYSASNYDAPHFSACLPRCQILALSTVSALLHWQTGTSLLSSRRVNKVDWLEVKTSRHRALTSLALLSWATAATSFVQKQISICISASLRSTFAGSDTQVSLRLQTNYNIVQESAGKGHMVWYPQCGCCVFTYSTACTSSYFDQGEPINRCSSQKSL